jgi:predicted transcriptional regulator
MQARRESFLATVKRHLDSEKGGLRRIAKESGVPYPTLTKISSGAVSDPRVSTVQTLFDYFAHRHEPEVISHGGSY